MFELNSAVTRELRDQACLIFETGIAAADPQHSVKHILISGDYHLEILLSLTSGNPSRLGHWPLIHVLAFGKAACSMAKVAREIIPAEWFAGRGIAVTNYENVVPVDGFDVYGAGHPLPDSAGLHAAQLLAEKAASAGRGELVLTLISGGASALLPAPMDGITLEEKIQTTELLLASGANINQINCVRKHLSNLKGGKLAKLAAPADLHAIILSDVIGDEVSAIASGPTVPDDTTYADAIKILQHFKLWDVVPASVRSLLSAGQAGQLPETPKASEKFFSNTFYTLCGSNRISLNAIIKDAQARSFQSQVFSTHFSGEARKVAAQLAIYAQQCWLTGVKAPIAILGGGESTVTLTGKGKGGRNQELALAFAIEAEKLEIPKCWVLLSGGTDGRDGPTTAAGGLIDGNTLTRIRAQGLNPEALLHANDSYTALKSANDLLETGATGTNVADLLILLMHPLT